MSLASYLPFGRAAVLLLSAVASTAAIAAQPFTERFDFVQDAEPMADCGDFIIVADGAGSTQLTTFFDRHGAPSRLTLHGNYSGLMTNSESGKSIADAPSIANITVDLVTGVQTNVGAYWTVTAPGQGVVLIEAGRLVFDGEGPPVFIAGPHLPPPAMIAVLCDALR